MKVIGLLEGNEAIIYFDEDNGRYYDIVVKVKETTFDWSDLSSLHQKEIIRQININWVQPL